MPRATSKPSAWLIGRWRSNKKKSLEGWLYPVKKRRKVQALFRRILGKLTFRFTKKAVTSWFEGDKDVEVYRVVWQNDSCCYGRGTKQHGQLINFTSPNEFWVHAGKNIEYFSRIRA
jgi:hypothetical protein